MDNESLSQSNEPVACSKNIVPVVLSVLITALIIGGAVYAWQLSVLNQTEQSLQTEITTLRNQAKELQFNLSTTTRQKSTDPNNELSYLNTSNSRYIVYEDLGISFFLPLEDTPSYGNIKVTRIDNKIFIHERYFDHDTGHSIEVFSKNPNQSIEDTIKLRFLVNKDEDLCWVEILSDNSEYPDGYQKAKINFFTGYPDVNHFIERSKYCTEDYVTSSIQGRRYFLFNQNSPDTYVFIYIGKYFIPVNEFIPWHETVRFL